MLDHWGSEGLGGIQVKDNNHLYDLLNKKLPFAVFMFMVCEIKIYQQA